MDQMDYTMAMDDTEPGRHHPNASPGCRYQPAHPSSNANNSGLLARDDRHYDPVHDATGWYTHSTLHTQHRSPFQPQNTQLPYPHNFSHWGGAGYTPNWQSSGEIQPGAQSQGQDPSGHRPQAGSMGMPPASWSDLQGYDHPFSYYPGSTTRPNNRALADQTSGRSSAQVPATGADSALLSFSSTPTQGSTIQQQLSIARALSNRNHSASTTPSNPTQPQTDPTATTEGSSRGPNPPGSLTELRNAHSRSARANRMSTLLDQPRRRAADWDSDDDEELAAEARSEIYITQFMDDERIMALHRGNMPVGKKVPTKAAIASLEPVKLEDLTDRVCSICYNEMGVSNPEGVTEDPLRLPKCHHTFGDKCIKKWFEDSDSCPYCRDTLPSEVPRRRGTAEEQMRMVQMITQRARLQAASQSHRNRRAVQPQIPSSEDTSRSGPPSQQDSYDYVMSRAGDVWGHSPPNRASPADSPENRRRQNRGRVGSNRTPHMLGRPTSVGSARFVNPTSNHQSASQRAQILGSTSHHGRPSLTRQASSGGVPSTNTTQTTPPRLAASPEEASPPVADGSNNNGSERRSQQQFRELHRQMNAYSQSFGDRLEDSFISRRSPSPSDGSPTDSRLFMHRSHPSVFPPSFSTSPPTSYTDLQDREARYRREEIFQNTMNATSQPRWSQ